MQERREEQERSQNDLRSQLSASVAKNRNLSHESAECLHFLQLRLIDNFFSSPSNSVKLRNTCFCCSFGNRVSLSQRFPAQPAPSAHRVEGNKEAADNGSLCWGCRLGRDAENVCRE